MLHVDLTSAATLTIQTSRAATIDVEATTLNGALNIQASSTTVVHLDKLTSVRGGISTSRLAELHLPVLASTATMTTGATVMDLSALATQADGGGSPITASSILNFNAPKLDISGVVSIVKATDITVSDIIL